MSTTQQPGSDVAQVDIDPAVFASYEAGTVPATASRSMGRFSDGSKLDSTVVKNNIDAFRGTYVAADGSKPRSPDLLSLAFANVKDDAVVDHLTLKVTPQLKDGGGKIGVSPIEKQILKSKSRSVARKRHGKHGRDDREASHQRSIRMLALMLRSMRACSRSELFTIWSTCSARTTPASAG